MSAARYLVVALAFFGLVACAHRPHPEQVRPAATMSAPRVVIVKSGNNPLFDAAIQGFLTSTDFAAEIYTLGGDDGALLGAVRAHPPALVFTLGTKATMLMRQRLPEQPLLFAMVVDHRRHELHRRAKTMGIALETPAATEFSQYKMVLPGMRRVLAFYAETDAPAGVQAVQSELAALGIDLVAVAVANAEAVAHELPTRVVGIDAIWLLNDPVLMNEATVTQLRNAARGRGIPLLASLSDTFAERGALMAVSVDFRSLGAQAAALASRHLRDGMPISSVGVQAPIGARLTLNAAAARELGITVPPDVLPFINRVVDAAP